jgi:hypothetical protein
MPGGRPPGSPNKLNKPDIDKRVTELENDLAVIRAMLPAGMNSEADIEQYRSGRDSAKAALGRNK